MDELMDEYYKGFKKWSRHSKERIDWHLYMVKYIPRTKYQLMLEYNSKEFQQRIQIVQERLQVVYFPLKINLKISILYGIYLVLSIKRSDYISQCNKGYFLIPTDLLTIINSFL